MFNLTKQERAVLIALGFIFLSGSIVHYLLKNDVRREALQIVDSDKIYPKVDINRATYEDLLRLPGVGPATAQSIITYREEYGSFTTIEDMRSIQGINSRNYSRLVKYLKI